MSEELVSKGFVAFMTPFIVLAVYFFAFWIGYRVVKSAVANGVRQALGIPFDGTLKDVLAPAIAEAPAEREVPGGAAGLASDADDGVESADAPPADSAQPTE